MIYSIDIETENEGIDVVNGVVRILSVQVGDEDSQEVYYNGARLPKFTLEEAKHRVEKMLDEGHSFSGYNIKNFDLPKLREFLGINIPNSRTVDIMETSEFSRLKKKLGWNRIPLEKTCQEYGIDASHKAMMSEFSKPYLSDQEIIAEARRYVEQLMQERGWSKEFSFSYAAKSLAFKQAIIDTYREFVSKNGENETLFYKYAIGDIVCEHKLFKLMNADHVP